MNRYKIIFGIIMLILFVNAYKGGYVDFYYKDIDAFYDNGAVMFDDNGITLGYTANNIGTIKGENIWDVIDYKNGYLFATNEGKIYYLENKDTTLLATIKGGDIFSLAYFNKKIICSVGRGKLYILNDRGKIIKEVNTDSMYIWKMIPYKDKLYLFSGIPAGIWSLDKQFNIKQLTLLPDKHILSAQLHNDTLFCGTDNGRIYVWSIRTGKGKTFFQDKNTKDIVSLSIIADTIYFLCSGKEFNANEDQSVKNIREEETDKTQYNLIRLYNGTIAFISSADPSGISVIKGKRHPYLIYSKGNKLKLLYNGIETNVITSDIEQFQLIKNLRNKIIVIGSPINYVFSVEKAKKGYIVSPVMCKNDFDADSIIRWGNISYKSSYGSKGDISIYARYGYTENIDTLWTKWQILKNGEIQNNTPYFQWKIVLKKSIGNPYLYKVNVSALIWDNEDSSNVCLDSIVINMPYNNILLSEKEEKGPVEKTRKLYADFYFSGEIENKKLLKIYMHKKDSKKEYFIDSTFLDNNSIAPFSYALYAKLFTDGWYELIGIIDENGDVLDSVYSNTFYIDNSPPKLLNLKTNKEGCEFVIKDNDSKIKSCYYSINYSPFRLIYPEDSLFDEKKEFFNIKEKNVNHLHILFFDENSNMGEYIE